MSEQFVSIPVSEFEALMVALRELLGSYEALIGRSDVSREAALGWDGPVLARRVLAAREGDAE